MRCAGTAFMTNQYDDFREVAHCGGKVTFEIRTDENGVRAFSVGYCGSSPNPMSLFGVYALPQGIACGDRPAIEPKRGLQHSAVPDRNKLLHPANVRLMQKVDRVWSSLDTIPSPVLLARDLLTQRFARRYPLVGRDDMQSMRGTKRRRGFDHLSCAFHVEVTAVSFNGSLKGPLLRCRLMRSANATSLTAR